MRVRKKLPSAERENLQSLSNAENVRKSSEIKAKMPDKYNRELRIMLEEKVYTKLQKKAESNGLTVVSYVRMLLMNMVN